MPRLKVLACLLAWSIAVHSSGEGTRKEDTRKKETAKPGPLAFTRKSIDRGKQFYLVNCVECHDQDGKGLGRRDFSGTPPSDLTDPGEWSHGTSAEAIFSSIREGTKNDMPPFKDKLQDEQIWHVVNFVRSLWPEGKRPKLETGSD
jgi:mono/diheme cytochrome c family protein